jgi:CRISPR system Cascade subunit CasA
MHNLLCDPLIRIENDGRVERGSLPDALAALAADRVDCFPALRAHQAAAWHMSLAQLGAIALHRAGLDRPPADAAGWRDMLRALTSEAFPGDEPWRLIVTDQSKPAFMQPPVPDDVVLASAEATPDAIDMLITSKNHDLKQSVAARAEADDWIFALISLQTCEGFGGSGNYGVARMNGGFSSRAFLGLMPLSDGGRTQARTGPWIMRDIVQMVHRRERQIERSAIGYPAEGGLALVWTAAWPQKAEMSVPELDIYFIEVCRRIRLDHNDGVINARRGTSSGARIAGKVYNGRVGDPWAPIHVVAAKALALGDEGEFDYRRIVDLIDPAVWELPLLATLGDGEDRQTPSWALVARAFARGQSKTGGYKERTIPLSGSVAKGLGERRLALHQLAKQQISEIDKIDNLLRNAIALAAATAKKSDDGKFVIGKRHRALARPFSQRLTAVADQAFFAALSDRFDASEAADQPAAEAARERFITGLVDAAKDLLREALDDIPCASIRRPRAEARAHARFNSGLCIQGVGFPEYYAPAPVATTSSPDASAETISDAA